MKILITGGCGFVGSNLAIFLKKNLKKSQILSLDNLYRKGSIENKKRLDEFRIKNLKIDIHNDKKIQNLPRQDLIIDCCAEPSVEISSLEPERVINTNLIGTFNILKKCKKDKSNIIFLSSSRVYSILKLKKLINKIKIKRKLNLKFLINENFDTSAPRSIYGLTKLCSEDLIKEFSYNYKIKYLINRFGVISGPWQFGKQDQGFFSMWIYKHLFKKELSYIGFGGYGYQVRDIIHIDDVCEIILKQIKKLKKINNKIFNIGGGKSNAISLKDLTKQCEKITNNKVEIKKIINTSKFDVPYYVSNNTNITKSYNWKPKKNIKKILMDTYNWMKNNTKIVKKNFD